MKFIFLILLFFSGFVIASDSNEALRLRLIECKTHRENGRLIVRCVFSLYNDGTAISVLGYLHEKTQHLYLIPNNGYAVFLKRSNQWVREHLAPPGSYDSFNNMVTLNKKETGSILIDFELAGDVTLPIACKVRFFLSLKGRKEVLPLDAKSFSIK